MMFKSQQLTIIFNGMEVVLRFDYQHEHIPKMLAVSSLPRPS
jgi:hypothetical protein